jgi:hypothetical protein
MRKIYLGIIIALFSMCTFTSCVDLNITPTSIITAEDIYNESGIKAYMAGMYNHLPMEDFHYDTSQDGVGEGGGGGYYVGNGLVVWSYWNSTGEMVNRNNPGFQRHRPGYWSGGFKIIRQANTLINDLPNYPALASQAKNWIAEAKFIRAYVYFQLAKRYGGLPKLFEPQVLGSDESVLWTPRESHADTYDFILADLDEAIADLPEKSDAGRANKYVAAAIKSRAALHAATTARYGSMKFSDWEVDGVLLQGIPASRANGYFKQAWDAAGLVENSGFYELHRANANKTDNYAEIWEKSDNNKESIWLRKFDFNMTVHSYNSMMCPPRMATEGGDRFNPTLDWVELFDGLPLDANGHFSAFDSDGNYLVYDNCHQLYDDAEPRLQANLLIPGSLYKGGIKLDVRAGIFDESKDPAVDKFKKFSIDDGADGSGYNSASMWNKNDYPTNPYRDGLIVYSTEGAADQQDPYNRSDGVEIFKNGLDGPRMATQRTGTNTCTGFFGRKYLDITVPKSATVHQTSTQPWIEIRYAEVLLNRAEAAIELAQGGETNYNGADMLQDAFKCINDIRERAGATLLTGTAELSTEPAYTQWANPGPKGQGGFVEAPNRALQILRVERYKELAYESKIYWDLHRWFTFDTQIRNYRKRGLYSFMYSKGATVDDAGYPDGKYIYDAKACEQASDRITFNPNNYYETIPGDELKNNPLLQKNRFQ